MTENNSQMRDESDYSLAKIAEWGAARAAELKREGRLGTPCNEGCRNEAYCEVNAESDFKQLGEAFRDARHAGLIEDHRNPDIVWAGEPALISLSPYSRDVDNTGQFSVDGSQPTVWVLEAVGEQYRPSLPNTQEY